MSVAARSGWRPTRPWFMGLAGLVAPRHPLGLDELLGTALRRARVADFADQRFVPALAVLLDSINEEARLSAAGRLLQRERLLSQLVNRARLEALLPSEAEAARATLPPLVVVAGLQRSGTTLLQRSLAAAPGTRSLPSWEALNPAPFPREDADASGRRRAARRARRAVRLIAPQFFAIHPIEVDEPEEEVLLLDLTFESQSAEAMLHVPSYARWLEAQDPEGPYRYLRRTLILLQRLRPGADWVLKSPVHLEHLDALRRVFPEAVVVQTHRDPAITLASFASMVAHGRAMFSAHVEPERIGQHWLRKVERMLRRALDARASGAAPPAIDVAYDALVADPVGTVGRVRRAAGLPWDESAERAVAAAVARQRAHRYGRHEYRAEDFGLRPDELRERFAFYSAAAPALGG